MNDENTAKRIENLDAQLKVAFTQEPPELDVGHLEQKLNLRIKALAIKQEETQNFFDYRPASITGTIYEDIDADGAFSAGDTPLAGVQVALSNGRSTISDDSGIYEFVELVPGSYTITETDLISYASSGDVYGLNDNTIIVNLKSGEAAIKRDFFDYRPVTITGLSMPRFTFSDSGAT